MKRSGAVNLLLFLAAGCFYSLSGGGGVPAHIRTVAVLPFENETPNAELPLELQLELRKALQSRLGLREAPEGRANAVVRGSVTRYEPDVPVGYSADPARANTARRRVQVAIDVVVLDQVTGRTLYERKGLSAEGEYAERAEPSGRRQAVQRLVDEIVEGMQSQW
jgi:hypothetical protein